MNGRMYDPELGRHLSADPYTPEPYSSQGYNRYSYVHNNPLRYIDPSGYMREPNCPGCGVSYAEVPDLWGFEGNEEILAAMRERWAEREREADGGSSGGGGSAHDPNNLASAGDNTPPGPPDTSEVPVVDPLPDPVVPDPSSANLDPEPAKDPIELPCLACLPTSPDTIRWAGTSYSWNLGALRIANYNWTRFTLTSAVVDGKSAKIVVDASGFGTGLGSPISNSGGSISFETPASLGLNPSAFLGEYVQSSWSFAPGGLGYGGGTIRLGEARSVESGYKAGLGDVGFMEVWGDTEIESFVLNSSGN